jgi:putative DNA primase/helicase
MADRASVVHLKPDENAAENVLADYLAVSLKSVLLQDSLTAEYYQKKGFIWVQVDKLTARQIIEDELKGVVSKYSNRKLNALISLLSTRLIGPVWTTDQNLVPLENGIYDWSQKKLIPYLKSHYFNWQLQFAYDREASCPDIEQWLEFVTDGDRDFKHFLLCWMAAVITGRHDLQKFLMLVGHAGAGKGVFTRLLITLVGAKNVWSTDLKRLEENRFETANIYDRRLVIIPEGDEYSKSVTMFKRLTGGDPIPFERKNANAEAPFIYKGLVAVSSNHPFNVADKSGAVSRRQSLAFFRKVPSEDAKRADPDFENRLQTQVQGLFNILTSISREEVTSALRVPPLSLLEAKLESEIEVNPILHWLHENVVICQEGDETPVGNADRPVKDGMFSNYREFCHTHGNRPVPLQKFSRLVVDACVSKGIDTDKFRGGETKANMIKGLRLRDELRDKSKPLLFVKDSEGPVKAETVGSEGQ